MFNLSHLPVPSYPSLQYLAETSAEKEEMASRLRNFIVLDLDESVLVLAKAY